MIIGANPDAVIENIRKAASSGDFYAKVETGDPVLSPQESKSIAQTHIAERGTRRYKTKAFVARKVANFATTLLNKDTQVVVDGDFAFPGGGVLITSNHFSPVENTVIRHFARELGYKRLNAVCQVTNLAMTGSIGFLMNYADTIPLLQEPHYMAREFTDVLDGLLKKGEAVLIYPEQEMWLNYRKPRPPKRGAYYFAAKLNAPIISCFVEMVDQEEMDTPEFRKVSYILHILGVLYPNPALSVKENSRILCEQDYALKTAAYEKAYGKRLTYDFESSDIAGWVGEGHG